MRRERIVALDEFHHERGDALTFLEPVERGDVGMVQRSEARAGQQGQCACRRCLDHFVRTKPELANRTG